MQYYLRLSRVEKVALPGFEQATCRSRYEYVNYTRPRRLTNSQTVGHPVRREIENEQSLITTMQQHQYAILLTEQSMKLNESLLFRE